MQKRNVLVIHPTDQKKTTMQRVEFDAIPQLLYVQYTEHHLLQATVPYLQHPLLLFVQSTGGGDKPYNRVASVYASYGRDVCKIQPLRVGGRAILACQNGDVTQRHIETLLSIVETKDKRKIPPQVEAYIKEREERDITQFPPGLQTFFRLMLPQRQCYGLFIDTP